MRTLRARLLVSTVVGTTLVLAGSGAVLHVLIGKSLWAEFDRALAAKARSLAALVEREGDEIELEFDEAGLPEYAAGERAEYYQVWAEDGSVLARSQSLGGGELEMIGGPADEPAFRDVSLPDGRRGRLAGMVFVPQAEKENKSRRSGSRETPVRVTLVVGRETAAVEGTLAQVRSLLIVVCLAAVAVSAGLLAWSVGRSLRPVNRLAGQIAGLDESALSVRIDSGDVVAELMPVLDRLNDLLGRLESAFHRERRFSADVAHELRTPLAGVRSMLEVALSREREADACREVMRDCLSVSQQMQQMVENLLGLARADAGQLRVERETFDLAALARQCWEAFAPDADRKRVQVEWRLEGLRPIRSDSGKVRLVLQNVLSNAVTYVNEGGRIGIGSRSDSRWITLTVTNTGSVLAPQDVERVFDRFWRGDSSRQSVGQHCGLGLSLCKTLVELLGGSISADSTGGGEFVVRVKLPGV